MEENITTDQNVSHVEAEEAAASNTISSELESKVAEIEKAYNETRDKFIRVVAELDNTKKRHEKELKDAYTFSVSKFAKEMTLLLDHIEIGLTHVNVETAHAETLAVQKGMESVRDEFLKIFQKFNIEQVKPQLGEKFNPAFHQAISKIENQDFPAGSIVSVVANGYTLDGRVLKEAIIVVN